MRPDRGVRRAQPGLPGSEPAAPRVRIAPCAVELHIGELVLHGFDPRDRHAIGDAVERELTRLFDGGGAARLQTRAAHAEFSQLDAGSFDVAPGAKAATVGTSLARSVFKALMR